MIVSARLDCSSSKCFREENTTFEHCETLYTEICEGPPATAIAEDNMISVGRLIEENRRITCEEIRGYFRDWREYNHGCANAVYDIVAGHKTWICYNIP